MRYFMKIMNGPVYYMMTNKKVPASELQPKVMFLGEKDPRNFGSVRPHERHLLRLIWNLTFWDEQWREHTEKPSKQGGGTPSTEDSTSYDPKGPWRHEQIHKKNQA